MTKCTPEQDIAYSRANPQKYLRWAAKNRARKDGIEFNIEPEDILIPEYCPILGVKLNDVRQTHKKRECSPSIDRIDNTKGYIKGNIAVISFKANRCKADMSIQDIERLYKYVKAATGICDLGDTP